MSNKYHEECSFQLLSGRLLDGVYVMENLRGAVDYGT